MQKIILTIACCVSLIYTQAQNKKYAIVPQPVKIADAQGSFIIDKATRLIAASGADQKSLALFNDELWQRYHLKLPVAAKAAGGKCIRVVSSSTAMPNEAYTITANEHEIRISGGNAGAFYGLQTLLQLISTGKSGLRVPAVNINDAPEFMYRGLMLDAARHFLPVDEVKKVINLMAYYKLNRLQWHLTDDQGWRLEIKKYPKLTQIGAYRDSTIIGHVSDFKPFIYDGKKYGGYYTQNDVRAIVKYAADRKITIIPEIELPGHSTAALAAYPQFGCKDSIYRVAGYWGVLPNIYCPKEATFKFLEDVFTEVMALFPGEYIHIGGDEAPKDHWKTSAIAQQVIKDQHLQDEHALQGYFITRVEKFLNRHGRRLIGWDEILEDGVAPSATIMSWRGERGGIRGAKAGHDVIMSPNSYLYADRYQSLDKVTEPTALGGFIPLDKLYNYNPRPDVLSDQEKKHVLGIQANMWTEYITSNNKLEYMLFPRMLAVAEVGWSNSRQRNYDDFSTGRLPLHLQQLENNHVFFRIPEARVDFKPDGAAGGTLMTITPSVANSTIYYTIDNHKADETAILYQQPVALPHTGLGALSLHYIIVTPKGRASNMFSVKLP